MRTLGILLLAATAAAQDLPPGVLLLSRIKRHVREEMQHLPDYTCLETVQRAEHNGGQKTLQRLDPVRLEVLFSGEKEMYSPPGAAAFSEDSVTGYIHGGMISDGIFATDAVNIFVRDGAYVQYVGEEEIRGVAAVKYNYRIPQMISNFRINAFGSSETLGIRGAFWADAKTYDLLRIQATGDEMMPASAIASLVSIVDFDRVRIGDRVVRLAQSARVRLLGTAGEESLAQFDFTHCRAFQAESTIRFGDDISLRPADKKGETRQALDAGLNIPVILTTGIDGATAVGAPILGKVAGFVAAKGKAIIPEGTVLHGRVRQMERTSTGYDVALEFTEIDMPAGPLRFFADLREPAPPARAERWLRELPGVAVLSVAGEKLDVPQGFRMVWHTRDLIESN